MTTKIYTEADLTRDADKIGWVGTDSSTPDGYYSVTAVVLGIAYCYLLDAETKAVVGRVMLQIGHPPAIYAGNGLLGGNYVSPRGRDGGLRSAFEGIVDAVHEEREHPPLAH